MADLAGAATGALSGLSIGSGIGGPIGGAAGAILGGVAGLFGKKKKKKKTLSGFDPQQQQLNQYQHQGILGQGPLADLYNYDPEAANKVFDLNVSNPAYRNFQEKLVPGITGQFRKEGLGQSSYVGDAISKAGRDVQESLDAKRAAYQYGEQQDARTARRQGVENLQNRNTFAYESGQKPFDITSVLNSITPSNQQQFKDIISQFSK